MTFMRFILEHPWISSLSIGVVAIGFLWTGLRDGKKLHSRIGAVLFCCAVLAWVVGSMIETPTEHAKRLIDALVQAVEHKNIPAIATLLTEDVILVDTWKDFQIREYRLYRRVSQNCTRGTPSVLIPCFDFNR